jgi:hypothetical protein
MIALASACRLLDCPCGPARRAPKPNADADDGTAKADESL